MEKELTLYKSELAQELDSILQFWKDRTIDNTNGGFIGQIDHQNQDNCISPKGSVLNARILWTFSAAFNLKRNPDDLAVAKRAFEYMKNHFIDHEFGGVYWMLAANGTPLDPKKQIYAQAFAVYAFSEYYLASGDEQSKVLAINIYKAIISYSYDRKRGGFFEAFTQDWKELNDLRLSDKDANEKKTMNTHLHILECFTTLYRIWPDQNLRIQMLELIEKFSTFFIHPKTGNLTLFFNEHWVAKSNIVSYGHDIEAAWLLLEAAEVLEDQELITSIKKIAVALATATIEGIDADGGLWYEFDPSNGHLIKEKHWWVQAEAMVGFFTAWQVSNHKKFLQISLQNWQFVKEKLIDHENGEWFWGITPEGNIMLGQDKVGPWKCPYHNSRACMEIMKRIEIIQSDKS